ncbi:MAG: hypothetical protein K8I60_12570 [Anaerolineae bacterium]|nr:hypothetical protein [Anaerolineae bacterium]
MTACQTVFSSATPGATSLPTEGATSEVSPTPDEWIELNSEEVQLRLKVPYGWQALDMEDGLLVAQQFGAMFSGDDRLTGIQIHIFVHSTSEFTLPTDGSNTAAFILDQIAHTPEYVGDAAVTVPQGFTWGGYEAAYYLLNAGDGTMTMVVALVVENPPRLVVCSILAPHHKAAYIRTSLPLVFHEFSIDGHKLDVGALYRLPFPLVFPNYDLPRPRPEISGSLPDHQLDTIPATG